MDSDAVVAGTMSLLKGLGYPILSISKHFEKHSNVKGAEAKGLNPGLIVLLVVGGLLISFLVGNYALYMYAQRTLPPRKKKPLSKKKLKKEKLRQGVSAPGE